MLNKAGSICGVVGLLVTVFGWLGVSPDSVGQTVYNALYVGFPVASGAFGILAGWCLHGLLVDSQAKQAAAVEEARQAGETERLRMTNEREEAERIRLEEAEAAAEEEDWQQQLDASEHFFRSEKSGEKKIMAVVLYGMDGHQQRLDGCQAQRIKGLDADSPMSYEFFTVENLGANCAVVRLSEWLEKLFDERPSVREGFPDEAITGALEVLLLRAI